MKILAVDTSTIGCSVSLSERHELIAEINLFNNETHSKHLMRLINSILDVAGINIKDVDCFAVSKGPGSFTGLRIGISTILGLSTANGKPVVGVSSLEALAYGVPVGDYEICAIIDARKNEVFIANYVFRSGKLQINGHERLCEPIKICSQVSGKTVFTGTGARLYRDLIRNEVGGNALFVHDDCNHVKAKNVAVLSLGRFENHDRFHVPLPCYIRKSDAEINRKPC